MKWTTMASALCCGFGSLIFLAALVLPNWRVGVGNWFLTDNPGVEDWAIFAYKQYGPLWTYGVYFQTWGSIANGVCQKMDVVYGLTVVEGVGAETFTTPGGGAKSWCIAGPDSECADSFAQHFQDRCSWYRQLSSLGGFVMAFVAIAFVMNMGCVMAIFLTRLKDSKFTVLCTLLMIQFMLHVSFWCWVAVSSMAFTRLALTGTYPYPNLGSGALVFMMGTMLHFFGAVSFWWFKFGGGRSAPGANPHQQRALAMGLLHEQQQSVMRPGGMQPGFSPRGSQMAPGGLQPGMMQPGVQRGSMGGQPGYQPYADPQQQFADPRMSQRGSGFGLQGGVAPPGGAEMPPPPVMQQ